MRIIYEEDIEHEDFIEIILSNKDYEKLEDGDIVKDFINPFTERNLNVYIRLEK